jgi:hypothetical protein
MHSYAHGNAQVLSAHAQADSAMLTELGIYMAAENMYQVSDKQ